MAIRPQHTVRMDEFTWERFGTAAARAGTDRATLLRQFALWYLREGPLPPRMPPQSVRSSEADHDSDLSPSAG